MREREEETKREEVRHGRKRAQNPQISKQVPRTRAINTSNASHSATGFLTPMLLLEKTLNDLYSELPN